MASNFGYGPEPLVLNTEWKTEVIPEEPMRRWAPPAEVFEDHRLMQGARDLTQQMKDERVTLPSMFYDIPEPTEEEQPAPSKGSSTKEKSTFEGFEASLSKDKFFTMLNELGVLGGSDRKGLTLQEDKEGNVALNAWENVQKFMRTGDPISAFKVVTGLLGASAGRVAVGAETGLGAVGGKVGRPGHSFVEKDLENIRWLYQDLELPRSEVAKHMTKYLGEDVTPHQIGRALEQLGLKDASPAKQGSEFKKAITRIKEDLIGKPASEVLDTPAVQTAMLEAYEAGQSMPSIAQTLKATFGLPEFRTQAIRDKIDSIREIEPKSAGAAATPKDRWTPDHIEALQDMVASGLATKEIVTELNRMFPEVKGRVGHTGFTANQVQNMRRNLEKNPQDLGAARTPPEDIHYRESVDVATDKHVAALEDVLMRRLEADTAAKIDLEQRMFDPPITNKNQPSDYRGPKYPGNENTNLQLDTPEMDLSALRDFMKPLRDDVDKMIRGSFKEIEGGKTVSDRLTEEIVKAEKSYSSSLNKKEDPEISGLKRLYFNQLKAAKDWQKSVVDVARNNREAGLPHLNETDTFKSLRRGMDFHLEEAGKAKALLETYEAGPKSTGAARTPRELVHYREAGVPAKPEYWEQIYRGDPDRKAKVIQGLVKRREAGDSWETMKEWVLKEYNIKMGSTTIRNLLKGEPSDLGAAKTPKEDIHYLTQEEIMDQKKWLDFLQKGPEMTARHLATRKERLKSDPDNPILKADIEMLERHLKEGKAGVQDWLKYMSETRGRTLN